MSIITDEQILSAYYGGIVPRRENSALVRVLRQHLETGQADCWVTEFDDATWKGIFPEVRDRLGGWAAVWRSVLEDLGFKEKAPLVWRVPFADTLFPVGVEYIRGRYSLWVSDRWQDIPLASPADLRERVGHLRAALGTKEADHA